MNTKSNFILLIILVLALLLRVHRIDQLPALNADEAAIGYNAYSLLITGRDEHGHPYPLEFQSFNDYKPGVYFYLVMPLIKLLSLSVLAVRLPNAIIGVISVWLIYIFTNQIFPRNQPTGLGNTISPGHIAALMLAFSPWHLHFSRGAWETNVATTLVLAGSVLYLARLRLSSVATLLVPLPFVLSLYTYHSARIFAPLLGLFLLSGDRPDRKQIFPWAVITLISLAPLLVGISNQQSASRFKGVGIIADRGPLSRAEELRSHHSTISHLNRLSHNKYIEYSLRIVDNYLRHFSPNFLFLTGDEIERNKVPESGQLFLFETITLMLGIGYTLSIKNTNPRTRFLFFWLAVSPLASSLTFQSPNALRAQNMVIPLTILSSMGIYRLLSTTPRRIALITSTIPLWSIIYYLHQYYNHLDYLLPYSSQYGYKEMIHYVSEISPRYDRIYITTRYDQPYILALFYMRYDPSLFQSEHQLTSKDRFGFSTVTQFSKFRFQPIDWDKIIDHKNTLIVAASDEVPPHANVVKTINFPNGDIAYKIIVN